MLTQRIEQLKNTILHSPIGVAMIADDAKVCRSTLYNFLHGSDTGWQTVATLDDYIRSRAYKQRVKLGRFRRRERQHVRVVSPAPEAQ